MLLIFTQVGTWIVIRFARIFKTYLQNVSAPNGGTFRENLTLPLSGRWVPRRNRGDTSMHLGGSVPRLSWSVHVGNAFRSRVSSDRSTRSVRSSELLPTWNTSVLPPIENWVSPLSATTQHKRHKDGSKRAWKATCPFHYGWLDETRTCCGIDMSVVPSSFNSVFRINIVGCFVQTEAYRHIRQNSERWGTRRTWRIPKELLENPCFLHKRNCIPYPRRIWLVARQRSIRGISRNEFVRQDLNFDLAICIYYKLQNEITSEQEMIFD